MYVKKYEKEPYFSVLNVVKANNELTNIKNQHIKILKSFNLIINVTSY